MLRAILAFHDAAVAAMGRGVALRQVLALPQKTEIARMKEQYDADRISSLIDSIGAAARALEAER
jgi:vacuolar-type H+-ATPase catalytic subunit A/Vma1